MTNASPEFDNLRHLVDAAAAHTLHYSVGFVKEVGEGLNTQVMLAGSGTLVSYKSLHGILTADHCITNFSGDARIGLIMKQGVIHRFILKKDTYEAIRIAPRNLDQKEPDLGFVRLSTVDASTLKATKSFVNLEVARRTILEDPPPPSGCFWGVAGVIEEWTSDETQIGDSQRIKVFGGMCGVGVLGRRYKYDEYDFVEFESHYGDGYEGPVDYGGLSGGGLWRFGVDRDENGNTRLGKSTFRGVAFYQSDIEENKRLITCHAEDSIYCRFIESIENKTA